MRRLMMILLLVVLTVSASRAEAGVSIINGGFETGDLQAWSSVGNVLVRPIGSTGQFGVHFNSSDSPPNGAISQTVSTVSGATCELKLDFAVRRFVPGTQTLQVIVDGATELLNETLVDTDSVELSFDQFVFQLTADSVTTLVRIEDNAANPTVAIDSIVDNVSLVCQPAAVPSLSPLGFVATVALLFTIWWRISDSSGVFRTTDTKHSDN